MNIGAVVHRAQGLQLLHELDLEGFVWPAYFTPEPLDDEFAAPLVGGRGEAVVVSLHSLDPAVARRLGSLPP